MHRYSLTPAGVRSAGNNFDQLAQVLWDEVRAIDDPEVRQGLLKRISHRLASEYREQLAGETLPERMESLASLMGGQRCAVRAGRVKRAAGADGIGLPISGSRGARSRRVCDGEDDDFGSAGRRRAVERVPAGRRDVLHVRAGDGRGRRLVSQGDQSVR